MKLPLWGGVEYLQAKSLFVKLRNHHRGLFSARYEIFKPRLEGQRDTDFFACQNSLGLFKNFEKKYFLGTFREISFASNPLIAL